MFQTTNQVCNMRINANGFEYMRINANGFEYMSINANGFEYVVVLLYCLIYDINQDKQTR